MKMFSWMQSKITSKQEPRKKIRLSANHNIQQDHSKEEFSDWPHGLLSIGTFGNNTAKKEEAEQCNGQDHLQDITLEQVGEFQKELKLILDEQVVEGSLSNELDTIFEIHKIGSHAEYDDAENKDNIVVSKGKDSRLDSANNVIGKKSVSFLLKKMFVCSSGFTPTRSLRDPLPELKLEKSRVDKILRAILNKKIYPQSSSPRANAAKKYLQNRQVYMTDSDDEMFEETNLGCKWDKTDSEFIVLEI